MSLAILAKAIVIAVCAGLVSGFYLLGMTFVDPQTAKGPEPVWGSIWPIIALPVSGSMILGLPIALLVLHLSWDHLIQSPPIITLIAVLAGIMMIIASYVIGSEPGVLLLGIPSFIAALTYALLGWLWILRPLRKTLNNPPQEKEIA